MMIAELVLDFILFVSNIDCLGVPSPEILYDAHFVLFTSMLFVSFIFPLIFAVPMIPGSRVSAKIQQLLNTLKRPKRKPLQEFFQDEEEELESKFTHVL